MRKPRELYSSREQQRNVSQVDFHQRIFTMSKYGYCVACFRFRGLLAYRTKSIDIGLATQMHQGEQLQLGSHKKAHRSRTDGEHATLSLSCEPESINDANVLCIQLQAKYRMYSARKQFLRAKYAATTIQRHVKARIRARADRKEYLALRYGAIAFQKTFRMFATRKLYRRKCVALKVIQVRVCVHLSMFTRKALG